MTERKITSLCFIFIALQLGYVFSFGNFSLGGIFILLATLGLLLAVFFKPKISLLETDPQNALYVALLISTLLTFLNLNQTILQPGILARPQNFILIVQVLRILLAVCFALQIFFFRLKPKFFFLAQIAAVAAIHFLIIFISPNPRIDTYDIVKIGSLALFKGENPYRINYIPLYPNVEPDYFSYTPGLLYLAAPFYYLFKTDHRYLFAVLEIAASLLIYKIASGRKETRGQKAKLLSLLFLFNPSSLFIVLRGWSDTAVLFLLALTFHFLLKSKKIKAAVVLGYIASIKQTLLFAPLFFLKYLKVKTFLLVPLTFLIITMPFFLASPKDFIGDTVIFHSQNPTRHDALMLNTLYYYYTKRDIPAIGLIAVWAIFLAVLVKKQKGGQENILDTLILWYLVFFLFNTKQAFVNYYYFIGGLIVLQISLLLKKR